METNTITSIRKTSSGLGFLLFAASSTMYTLSFIFLRLFILKIDNNVIFMMDIIVSIISLFLVGIIYCWLSSTSLVDVIKVKWVKLNLAVPLILISLTVAFTADYLTEIIQNSFSVFGVKNSVNLETESHTLIENILNITAVSIIPPLVEEFLFRGIVLGKLRNFGDAFALFLTSMLFALMHGNIIQIPFTFIVGLSLAFITIKSDSIVPAIVVHFIINFRSIFISVIYDNNLVSEDIINIIYIIFILVVFVSGIISAAVLCRKNNFFKLDSHEGISFKQTLKTSILSIGMIFFLINSVITTLQTISVSWLNLDGVLF